MNIHETLGQEVWIWYVLPGQIVKRNFGILLHIGISDSRLKEEGHHDASSTRRNKFDLFTPHDLQYCVSYTMPSFKARFSE